jgi:hypothetical protein
MLFTKLIFSLESADAQKKETVSGGLFFLCLIQEKNIEEFQLRMMP